MNKKEEALSFPSDEKESVHDRILMLQGNRSSRTCADDWKVPHSTLVSAMNRKSDLKLSILQKISLAENTSIDWIANGKEIPAPPPQFIKTDRIQEVPKYNVAASAGGGSMIDEEHIIEYYPFTLNQLKKLRLIHADLCVIEAVGDSMEPTIESGDDLLIKRHHEKEENPLEGVYVINLYGDLRVKRLKYNVGRNGYRVISDNSLYKEEFVKREDLINLNVIGEVAMVMGRPTI